MGVTIAFGTDAGVFPHGQNARELELMVEAGLTPAEAVRSATATAARVLRQEGRLGVIAEGASADAVAVRSDALRTVEALRDVALVVSRGAVQGSPTRP